MQEKNPNAVFVSLFPKLSRFITEGMTPVRTSYFVKIVLVSFISGMILLGVYFQSVLLGRTLHAIDLVATQRVQVSQEISYWEQFLSQHGGYRDVYMRLASLQYRVGNVDAAKMYLQKAIELDPNFEAGKVLGAKITGEI